MDDIVLTTVELDDETYSIRHYWKYDDGSYSVCDTDGNHNDCTEADVTAAFENCDQNWKGYWAQVARTGEDYLGQLIYPTRHRAVWWRVIFRASILGPRIFVRRRGRGPVLAGREIPRPVREFLCLDIDGHFDLKLCQQFVTPGTNCVSLLLLRDHAQEILWDKRTPRRPSYEQKGWIKVREPMPPPSKATVKRRARAALRK